MTDSPALRLNALQRLHQVLMPDYDRKSTACWWLMAMLGSAALVHSLWVMRTLPLDVVAQVVAGAALAAIAGYFPLRMPGSKNTFIASEIFTFLVLLLYGAPAATVAVAAAAFAGTYRSSSRWTRRIAAPVMSAVAMFLAAHLLTAMLGKTAATQVIDPARLLPAVTLVALVYFAANAVFTTLALTLKRRSPYVVGGFTGSLSTIGIAYGSSALLAAMLFLAVQHEGMSVLLGALPVLAVLLTIVHYFLRRRVPNDRRRSRIQATEREAEQSSNHVVELQRGDRRFHSAFTHASIGMALVSFKGRILQANPALVALLGGGQSVTLVGKRFGSYVLDSDLLTVEREFARIHAKQTDTFAVEVRCRDQAGTQIWAALHCSFFSEADSASPCLILQVQDISARRHAEAQLSHMAFHDGLTGLPNRGRFHALLVQALAATRDDPSLHFALMFFDFDRFKLINDSMGHSAGDEFLIQVSRRLQEHVRPGDVVARLGGDEFAVLVHRVDHEEPATLLAERLQQVLGQPLKIAGVSVTTSASIGITFSNLGYDTPEDLLRDADIAMYRAKAAGKARYAVFDAALHREVADRLGLESDLRQALVDDEIDVAYQPLFNLRTGNLYGFEALARWNHESRGDIHPSSFIPIAEETTLITELTDRVLARACRQLRQWQLRHESLRDLRMQVNISSNDLAHSALAERVGRILRETHVEPQQLTLELTENILMQRVEGVMPTLEALRRLGVGLAIDDFGTGYSSLSYLSSLPIDSLKIDRSFVNGMRTGSKDAEIVRAIVSLGASLGKSVVAEGIETQSQLAQLQDLDCESGQGFHLSRPLSPSEVELLLDSIILQPAFGTDYFVGTAQTPLARH